MNLDELPDNWPQRQDSVNDQLADLRVIANRLGFYDAADAIGQIFETKKYGCHIDEDSGEPVVSDCVLDNGRPQDCSYCLENRIKRKEQCEYWRVVK